MYREGKIFMKVSVIVPIYNGKKFIEECCFQLASQTLNDIEFILVDDGSIDIRVILIMDSGARENVLSFCRKLLLI